MKNLFTLVAALLLLCTPIIAQNNLEVRYRQCNQCNDGLDATTTNQTFTYGDSTEYPADLIADDYGPRQNGADTYDWHGGIDYNSGGGNADMGDLILAIRGGTITGSLGSGYKRLIVQAGGQNFGYGHLFTDDTAGNWPSLPLRSGGCWLKVMNDNFSRCIVMVIDGDTTAIGTVTGTVSFDGKSFSVSNTIAAGAPIGPTGYSALNSGAHLHLFSEPNGLTSVHDTVTKNPLQYVDYAAPTYEIQLRKVINYNNNETEPWSSVSYPGTNSSPIVVRPIMQNEGINLNRYNTLNHINRVELLIKKQYESSYKTIEGATRKSDIRLGGRIGEEMLPDNMHIGGSPPNIGSLTRQGIRPFAYATTGAHPYDDYYFPNLIPRLHRDTNLTAGALSYCPMSSRYNDGRYQLKARITDVRNNATDGSVQEFVIDNYKPFIQEVKVNLPNVTEPFYQRYWVCNDNTDCKGMYLTTPGATNNEVALAQIRNGIWINVTASEPLANLTLDIADSNIQDVQAYESFEDGRKWQFVLNSQQMSTILGKQSIEFLFYGYDWNNPANHLINLKTADGAQTCVKIPKREDADSWEHDRTTGPDELHFFNPKCGQHGRSSVTEEEPVVVIIPDESCFNYGQGITREVTAASNESASDGAITLHVEGGIEPYRYEWWNGNTTNQATGLAPGNYCVRVYDALCCETQVCIEVPACQKAKLSAQITKTCEGQQTGTIDLNVEGGSGGYTFLWSNGATTQDLWNLGVGTYCVTITSPNGCPTKKCFNVLGEMDVVVDEFYWNFGDMTGDGGRISISVIGSLPVSYIWTGPAGFSSTQEDLINLSPGTYTLLVNSGTGCAISRTFEIGNCYDEEWKTDPGTGVSYPEIVGLNFEQVKIGITGIIQSSPNANDGNAQVNLLEGTPPLYYHWRGDHGVEASTASISGLASGLYCVTVTNGCTQDEACIDLRDCSEKGPRLTENITHTCPGGYEAGSIKLGIEGGKQPFAFVWNNGATTQNLENLGFGIFCVTVTDADGCVATGCFEVLSTQEFADKIDHDGSYCYVSTYCNNLSVAQSDIQALDCNYDDPSNCTIQNCYCPLDNSQVTSTSTGYSSYMVDPASCTLRGLCPGSGGWEIVENGYFETQSFFTYCAGSFCGTCHYVTYCVFDLGTYIASEYSTPATVDCEFPAPWCSEMGSNQWYNYYCDSSQPVTGHCGIPNRVLCPQFLTAEESGLKDFVDSLNVGQIFRLMQDSGLISMETNLLLPQGFIPGTKARVYTDSIGSLGQQNLSIFNRTACDGINCTGLVCHTDIPGSLREGGHDTGSEDSSNFDFQIAPNPSTGNFMLKVIRATSKNSHLDLHIRDVTGRIVLHRQYETVSTGDELTLETQKLPPGMYMVVLEYSNGMRRVEKVIRI